MNRSRSWKDNVSTKERRNARRYGKRNNAKYNTLHEKENPDWIYYPDTFVQGGNCGNVLMHYGEFRIEEISENEINEDDEIIYEEDI